MCITFIAGGSVVVNVLHDFACSHVVRMMFGKDHGSDDDEAKHICAYYVCSILPRCQTATHILLIYVYLENIELDTTIINMNFNCISIYRLLYRT